MKATFTCFLILFFQSGQAALAPLFDLSQPNVQATDVRDLSPNPFKSSIEGMASVRFYYDYWSEDPKFSFYKFKSTKTGKKLKFQSLEEKPEAPWIFYVPGIFTYLKSPFAKFFSQKLKTLGFNVVMVPNTFTADFLKANPSFLPGDIPNEARLFCELIDEFKTKKGINQSIEVVGVSYGGLLSSSIVSQCPQQFSRLTIISPPVDMTRSMAQVFDLVDQSRKRNPSVLTSSQTWMYLKARIGFTDQYTDLLSRFFLDGLYYTLFLLKKQTQEGARITKIHYGSRAYRLWQKETDLKSFYLNVPNPVPENYQLSHWLGELKSKGFPFFVYSSLDDPINSKNQWKQLTQDLPQNSFGFLPKGGHLGVANSLWFDRFLQERFKEAL
ncbi:MAG: alpha/beta fold hydrolase [Pseudomonadota bacterium]